MKTGRDFRPHRLADGRVLQEIGWCHHAAANAHVIDIAAVVALPGNIPQAVADLEIIVEERGNRVRSATRSSDIRIF